MVSIGQTERKELSNQGSLLQTENQFISFHLVIADRAKSTSCTSQSLGLPILFRFFNQSSAYHLFESEDYHLIFFQLLSFLKGLVAK